MAHIDAFSVEACFNHGERGLTVYVEHDEVLPLCYRPAMKSGPSGLHLVFFCITIPGVPTIAVLMKSGSKQLPARLPKGIKFWWQMLADLGIGSSADEEYLEKVARAGFKVLFLPALSCKHFSTCCCMLHPHADTAVHIDTRARLNLGCVCSIQKPVLFRFVTPHLP